MSATIAEAVNHAWAAKVVILPPKEDGTKRPDVPSWKSYLTTAPTLEEVRGWYKGRDRTGMGVVCGAVSGGLEMLEFEGRAVEAGILDDFRRRCEAAGLGDLLGRVEDGYRERTPSGGVHLFYRCATPLGNTRLAARPATADELAEDATPKVKVLIETRGEGGYCVTAPSNSLCHPTRKPWVLERGGWGTLATITDAERDALFDIARTFDQEPRTSAPPPIPRLADEERPGDRYNARADAQAETERLLVEHGWTVVYRNGQEVGLRRPGKDIGLSATLGHHPGQLWVFSTSTEFEAERGYTPFAVYALLEHGSDFSAAARALEPPEHFHVDTENTSTATVSLVLRSAASIKPRLIEWLWRNRIPLGKLTMLDGRPGLFKSGMTLDIAARVTRGLPMPDGTLGTEPSAVIIVTAEDDWEDTVVPRLMAAGADLDRVFPLHSLTLPEGTDDLEAAVTSVDARLLVIDPLVAFVPGKYNLYRDQDSRRALAPLAAVMQRTRCAGVGLRHTSKMQGISAQDKGTGSVAIGGAARSNLIAGPDPDSEGQFALAMIKSNLGPIPPTLSYRIATTPVTIDGTVAHIPVIDWLGEIELHADDLVLTGKQGEAAQFLQAFLADGSKPAKEVETAAGKEGLSWTGAVRRAAERMGIEKIPPTPGKKGDQWRWALPISPSSSTSSTSSDAPDEHQMSADEHVLGSDLTADFDGIFGDMLETDR